MGPLLVFLSVFGNNSEIPNSSGSVPIRTANWRAHAVIVSPNTAIVPLHITNDPITIRGEVGEMTDEAPTLELARYTFDGEIGTPAKFAKESAPSGTRCKLGERKIILRGRTLAVFDGRWLALRKLEGTIKRGDSGSALVNEAGEVVGIVCFRDRRGNGYAADVEDVRNAFGLGR